MDNNSVSRRGPGGGSTRQAGVLLRAGEGVVACRVGSGRVGVGEAWRGRVEQDAGDTMRRGREAAMRWGDKERLGGRGKSRGARSTRAGGPEAGPGRQGGNGGREKWIG